MVRWEKRAVTVGFCDSIRCTEGDASIVYVGVIKRLRVSDVSPEGRIKGKMAPVWPPPAITYDGCKYDASEKLPVEMVASFDLKRNVYVLLWRFSYQMRFKSDEKRTGRAKRPRCGRPRDLTGPDKTA